MTSTSKGNALVMQSGGCTPVINSSLFGIYDEASRRNAFESILGASSGLEGILAGKIVDLGNTSQAEWTRISRTPGAALGSTRRKMRPEDTPVILDVFKKHDIRYMFIIGGNDSAETGHSIGKEFANAGRPLTIVNVPKTIDNDLVMMDHCPGYGSAARFIALATMGAGRDAEAMGRAAPITILEVMGRDAGWLAAAAILAKRDERDAPHLICVPEVPVDEDTFIEQVEDAYRRFGFAVAVMAENTRGRDGILGGQAEPWFVDDFGHPYYDGPARYLAGQLSRRLKVRARYEKPGTIQRSMVECLSQTDVSEAEAAGRAAVRLAIEGHSDIIVTLERGPGDDYECATGTAPLESVAAKVRVMPEEFLERDRYFVSDAFSAYARPLIGGDLPRFGRIAWGS